MKMYRKVSSDFGHLKSNTLVFKQENGILFSELTISANVL